MNPPLSPEERAEIIRRRIAGESPRALAREFGVSAGCVAGILRRAGVTTRSNEHGGQNRIPPATRAIILAQAARTSASAAARAWGLHHSTVSAWVRSRSPAPRSEVGA